MDLGPDFALMARLQTVLEKNPENERQIIYDSESFLTKIGEIAERTRSRSNSRISIDDDDVRKALDDKVDIRRFVALAIEAGLLVALTDPPGPAFRDAFERDAHAARYLMQFLESDYMDRGLMRDRAVDALIRIGTPAIPALFRGLGHPDSAVRLAASVALRNLGTVAVPALMQALSYGNEEVRRHAIQALTTPESSKLATQSLIAVLLNDAAPLVRAAAALALKEGATNAGVDGLVDALKDKNGIVVAMVKAALKDLDTPLARRALQNHLAEPTRSGSPEEPQWPHEPATSSTQPPRIFLSYPREHRNNVSRVRKLLTDAGFDVWLDSEGLLAGQQWAEALGDAIRSSDFVVAFLSKETSDGYQPEELKTAVDYMPRGRSGGSTFILPCVVDVHTWDGLPETVPDFLREYHMIDMRQLDAGWPRLREAITTIARNTGFVVPVYLRSEAQTDLRPASVNRMLIQRNFYDREVNDRGRPPYLDFGGLQPLQGGMLVQDLATDRIWTRDCFEPEVKERHDMARIMAAHSLKAQTNREKLGGFSDWRIPTIEEAMSLMTPHVRMGGLHISELFSDEHYVLTCDGFVASAPQVMKMSWFACYGPGHCQPAPSEAPAGVRLVRFGLQP